LLKKRVAQTSHNMVELTEKQKKILGKYAEMGTESQSGDPDVDRVARIRETMQPEKGLFDDTKQIVTNIKEDAGKRMDTMQAIQADEASGKQGFFRSALQKFGQGAGLASDVIGNVLMGGIKQATPEFIQEPVGEAVKGAVGAVVETEPVQKLVSWYSNLDPQKKRDLDAVLGTVSLATDVIGGAFAKPAGKAVVKTAGKVASKAGEVIEPITKGVKSLTTDVVDPASIMQRVARINPTQQVKFKDMAKQTVGEYLTERKIFGSAEEVAQKLATKFQESKTMADDALATLKGKFKPTPVKTVIDDLLKKEVSISSKGALSKDLKTVMQWKNKFQKDGLTMSEINDVKRLYERNVKLDYLRQNLPEGVKRANTIDDAIRKWQTGKAEELGLANLPEINKETQLSRMLADALGKKLAGSEANNAVSLTDWIMLSGGNPTSIGGYIGKRVLSSGKLQGKVAEFSARKGTAKTVSPKFTKPRPSMEDFMKK
jgi:hypothetical protein